MKKSVPPGKCYYRIKTEEEFKRQFGENWRSRVCMGFPDEMDSILGKRIRKKDVRKFSEYNNSPVDSPITKDRIYEWTLGRDMLARVRVREVKP